MNSPDSLTALSEELESVADKLRADAIAARLGAEIDARARGAAESEGQERLL